jgi:hypothetical protein
MKTPGFAVTELEPPAARERVPLSTSTVPAFQNCQPTVVIPLVVNLRKVPQLTNRDVAPG